MTAKAARPSGAGLEMLLFSTTIWGAPAFSILLSEQEAAAGWACLDVGGGCGSEEAALGRW